MKILALDGNSIINRAFYGIRLLTNKDGIYTNAVYGFLSILFIGLTFALYMKNKLFSTGVNEVAINLFGFSFQPAEFLKIFLVMYMASYYDDWIN